MARDTEVTLRGYRTSIHNKLRKAQSEQARAAQRRSGEKCEWDLAVIKYSHALSALNEYAKGGA